MRDKLVPLLSNREDKALGYRQGVIVSWNQLTAENTVLVGDTVLTNLPILNTSEASILSAGDVVGILTGGPTYAILGRLTIPGTPEAVSSIESVANRIQASVDAGTGTRSSASFGDLTGASVGPSVTMNIGPSGRALVIWSAEFGYTGAFMTLSRGGVSVAVSGATTVSPDSAYTLALTLEHPASPASGNATNSIIMQMSLMHLFTGLNPGSNTFTLKYRNVGTVPTNANVNFSQREIAVFAL